MKHLSLILTAGASLAAGACVASASVYGYYNGFNDQRWGITMMPDFDQHRTAGSGVSGLPGNGGNYCVPTATMNVLGYISAHGYPTLWPGVQDWHGGGVTEYNLATAYIDLLGDLMDVDPVLGCGSDGWPTGTRAWLPESQFDLVRLMNSANQSTTTRDIAQLANTGALPLCAYGRYTHDFNELLARNGGHFITPIHIALEGSLGSEFRYRDPATGGWNATSQSAMATSVRDGDDLFLTYNGESRYMTRLGGTFFDTTWGLIDDICGIFPKQGLIDIDFPPAIRVYTPYPLYPQAPIYLDVPVHGVLYDFDRSPDRSSIGMITDSDVPGLQRLQVVDVLTGDTRIIADETDATALVFCRRGFLTVASGPVIYRYDIKADPIAMVGANELPGGAHADALAYDDLTDEVVILSHTSQEILRYGFELTGQPQRLSVLVEFDGQPMHLAVSPTDGRIWIASEGEDVIYGLTKVAGANILAATTMHVAPGEIRGLSIDDRNHLFTVENGRVVELQLNDLNQLEPAPDSLFAGMTAGSFFDISRSRTNYDPALHDTPGWNFDIPLELINTAESIVDCIGDFNVDGVVDVLDLLGFLERWFAQSPITDLDGNLVTDVIDLLEFLAGWFTGC